MPLTFFFKKGKKYNLDNSFCKGIFQIILIEDTKQVSVWNLCLHYGGWKEES